MRHLAARIGAALVAVAAMGWSAPARADVPGFAVRIEQAPATFTNGKAARSLTAVVSTEREGRRCLKVRWALSVATTGVSLDQIRVTRVENNRSFDVRVRVDENAVQIVDTRLDPGQLCRDRTVTGRWDIAFTGPDDGEVRFEARALDVTGRQLSASGADARVGSAGAARPSAAPSRSASPSPSPSETVEDEAAPAGDAEAAGDEPSADAAALTPASGSSNVLGIGLIVGALMVFLGVGMLLRLRMRNRRAVAAEVQPLPTGFSSMPRRR